MAAVVMVLGLVPVVQNMHIASSMFVVYTPDSGCTMSSRVSITTIIDLQACNLLSNLLVVVITWYTTRFHGPIASSNGRGSLMTILRRNGIFASRVIGNMGEMLENDTLAFEGDLDHQETHLNGTQNTESSNHRYMGEEPCPEADERGLVALAGETSNEHGAYDNVVDEEEIPVISNSTSN
ncbi:hypothetical protein IEO21_08851 [Rhodonia placenta]|uniref:Uncharacterized protein n=1 Tax=Rhodonia placenta TaxID=104341 RepID=A0A8H7NVP1_9APHY|nr:hypothetical protein IEO21_08851 [Postia placenta]